MSYDDFFGQGKEIDDIVNKHANDFTYNTYS